jgi:hypothetical protein
MSEFRERAELLQRILELCRLAQEGKPWARPEMRMEVARLREAYAARDMTAAEVARRMTEYNRKKQDPSDRERF